MGSKVSVANNQISVNWDNLSEVDALLQNNPSKKPILVIQAKQSTEQSIGADFPLLREAIETEFLIGKESTEAQGFRIIDFSGKVLVPQDANFSVLNVVHSLTKALELSHKEVPQYLRLLQYDLDIEMSKSSYDRATFSMGCYWQGEVRLGQLDGVLQTEAGWWLSDEIVGVIFDSKKLSYSDLVRHAYNNHFGVYAHDKSQAQDIKNLQLGIKVKERDPKALARGVSEGERKYHLKQNQVLRFLPLIPSQAAKVNSSVGSYNSDHWKQYLSPRQIQLVKEIKGALGDERKARLLAKLGPCNHQLSSVANYDAQLSSIVL